jgi:hypothetical protein
MICFACHVALATAIPLRVFPVYKSCAGSGAFSKMLFRASGTLYQVSTAVWADVIEFVAGTVFAECAFETTNSRVVGLRRQVNVTAFAIGF